jgi:hypothetical protein
MRNLFCFISICFLAACSGSKYTASFPPRASNYYAVENSKSSKREPLAAAPTQHDALQLEASTQSTPSLSLLEVKKDFRNKYVKLSTPERKEVRQLLRKEIKTISKNQNKEMSVSSTKAAGLDQNLKLAAIFGAVGIVGLLLGTAGQFFVVIGAISLIIGVVFFVKWLLTQ